MSGLRGAVHRQEQDEGRLWDCHLEAFLERDGLFASRFQFLQPLVPAANVLKLEDSPLPESCFVFWKDNFVEREAMVFTQNTAMRHKRGG